MFWAAPLTYLNGILAQKAIADEKKRGGPRQDQELLAAAKELLAASHQIHDAISVRTPAGVDAVKRLRRARSWAEAAIAQYEAKQAAEDVPTDGP